MDRVLPPPLVVAADSKLKIKLYPHFDDPIGAASIVALVTDPGRVSKNTFYPFLRYEQRWQPFRNGLTGKPPKKIRPIRYASRRDAYIYAYYRHLLVEPYEKILSKLDLAECVSAYRKIRQQNGAGKSNIEFARDAFDAVRQLPQAGVVAIDISSFFESIDHQLLLKQWCRVLDVDRLPADHRAVYRAITRYAVVERDDVYRRLGYLTNDLITGHPVYTRAPKKLCSNIEFRREVCGLDGGPKSLIDVNRKPYGIPQGSPISDMLANIYMIDFDARMNTICQSMGGIYRRYSDDVLMVVPGGRVEAEGARNAVVAEISNHGAKLKIKDSKTAVLAFAISSDGRRRFEHVAGEQGKNGLEYLGFRFDGEEVWLRDATVSRLYRKISGSVRAAVGRLVKRYPGRDAVFIANAFDYGEFFQRYGRVDDFDPYGDVETWTFWTYAKKARAAFGPSARPIPMQLRRYKDIVKKRVQHRIAYLFS